MLIIARAALLPYEGTEAALPAPVWAPDEIEGAYFSQVAEKLIASDGSRATKLLQGDTQAKLLSDFTLKPFAEAANALLLAMDDAIREAEAPAEGYDMAVFTFEKDGGPHLCVARLGLRSVLLHRDELREDGSSVARLGRSMLGMPSPGSKDCYGFVADLSSGEIRLRDCDVPTVNGPMAFFGSVLFRMEETRTEKAAVKAVQAALREEAPANLSAPELEPAILRAMSRQVEETGAIDVREVAREVYAGAPEQEAFVERVAQRMEEEAVAPTIPVESKRVASGLQRLKLRTDTGIQLTMPRELADDADRFSVISNEDGTISIWISKIGELRTE